MSRPVPDPPKSPRHACDRQAAYAAYRRAWRAAMERWLADDRPPHLEVEVP